MVLHGVPRYGLVYGNSGTVHVVEGELDPIPPLVQVMITICDVCANWHRLYSITNQRYLLEIVTRDLHTRQQLMQPC